MAHDRVTYLVFGVAVMCLLLSVVAATARAEDAVLLPQPEAITPTPASLDPAAADPVKDLIRRELQAIRNRDADTAFALISPDLHEKFETAKNYLSHMRFEYRTIYNHAEFTFLESHDVNGATVQKVEIEDRNGTPITIMYRIEPQESGSLAIDSFTILEAESDPI